MNPLGWFPLLALLGCGLALWQPEFFNHQQDWIMPLLMLVMLGMGMTLKITDFVQTWQLRKLVLLGVGLQFLIMPLAAWALAKGFGLPADWLIGMLLVGSTAGGTASNVMTYLAKGNTPLSVSMTLASTLVAIFALPFLIWFYLGQVVEVPAQAMLLSMVQLILVPLMIGMLFNHFFAKQLQAVTRFLPFVSMLAIVYIITIIVALNQHNLQTTSLLLIGLVMLHNLIGMASGYSTARLLGYDTVIARTLAIEVGMQNSGLSVALAVKYFSAASALPAALFSIWHNLSGAIFAIYWRNRPPL